MSAYHQSQYIGYICRPIVFATKQPFWTGLTLPPENFTIALLLLRWFKVKQNSNTVNKAMCLHYLNLIGVFNANLFANLVVIYRTNLRSHELSQSFRRYLDLLLLLPLLWMLSQSAYQLYQQNGYFFYFWWDYQTTKPCRPQRNDLILLLWSRFYHSNGFRFGCGIFSRRLLYFKCYSS